MYVYALRRDIFAPTVPYFDTNAMSAFGQKRTLELFLNLRKEKPGLVPRCNLQTVESDTGTFARPFTDPGSLTRAGTTTYGSGGVVTPASAITSA